MLMSKTKKMINQSIKVQISKLLNKINKAKKKLGNKYQ